MDKPYSIEKLLNAQPGRVWQALTDKDQMKQWYFDLAEFRPEVGFEFGFTGKGRKGEEYHHICRVTAVEPERKLSYTWSYKGFPGMSEVTFELFPEGDKTRLVLIHSGIESFAANGPDFQKESFAQGWTQLVGTSLPDFLDKTRK